MSTGLNDILWFSKTTLSPKSVGNQVQKLSKYVINLSYKYERSYLSLVPLIISFGK